MADRRVPLSPAIAVPGALSVPAAAIYVGPVAAIVVLGIFAAVVLTQNVFAFVLLRDGIRRKSRLVVQTFGFSGDVGGEAEDGSPNDDDRQHGS